MKKVNKNILAVLMCLLITTVIISCSKKDTTTTPDTPATTGGCPTCATVSVAAAANNTSSKGIYIGVLIGSTGNVKFDVANNGTTVTGVLVIDGVTVNLTSTTAPTAGAAFSGTFTGKLNGADISVKFSIDANGKNPVITVPVIPGHPSIQFLITKELSGSIVEAYNGTYTSTKPEAGTFNFLVDRVGGTWNVIHSATGSTEVKGESGTLSGSNLLDVDGHVLATLGRNSAGVDVITGTFNGGGSGTEVTTLSGTRTL